MKNNKLKSTWALVTGASSGLGVDFARELAGFGCNLVLAARRKERLEQVQAELIERFGVSVKIIPVDLASPAGPQELYDQIRADGIDVDVLVNNAGFGLCGRFYEVDWQREQELLRVNIEAVTHLTRLFVADMVKRNFGYVLNVGSNGAYQATPFYAIYAASKSFILHFSEALNYELKGTNVKCTAVCPGTVFTEFHKIAGGSSETFYTRFSSMESSKVVHMGIDAMLKGKPSIVPGWKVALMAWMSQRAPRRWATSITGRLMNM